MPKDGSEISLDGSGMPMWLTCELTYKCPLNCPWCNNPLDFNKYRNELTTDEWKQVLREGRKIGSLQLGFTGGEPALRDDLEELVAYAEELGYYTNLITSGMGVTKERLKELKKLGLKQIQLSIQSSNRDISDSLVGLESYDHKLQLAHDIKALDFPLVLNIPVCRQNIEQTEDMLTMAEDIGVDYVEFANLQYYNWALLNRSEFLPTQEQLERAEEIVNRHRERDGNKMTIYFVIPDYYADRPKACMNGWGAIHLTIAPDGAALPCQEARVIDGLEFPNVREHPLEWIWHESPVFKKFRGDDWMKEPCRSCDEKGNDFGGCRCQAFLLTGDAANTDPVCSKSPLHGVVEASVAEAIDPNRQERPIVMRRKGSINMNFLETTE
ncbi:MAG: pyrroloquinoline quinone biosynthesis protein PqqE [Gammaproteobacteria bacterium]|nr:pyrroloquinoline quinone biosynthesis protein PqqE [Gammaproteobacteria bacterium]